MGEDKEVNTDGGAYVGGNVSADKFIGRDNIGTQIINYFQGGLDPQQLARARALLLKHVYDFWVDGVLHKSLHNEILLSLGMETRFGAVDNRPWDMILQTPTKPDRPLPFGTKISTVFDHSLLILGTPGAGKTTMLLELTRDLLARAGQDPEHPIPVVFNLSSWAVERSPLAVWLVDELNKRYPVSKKVAQHWVEHDALLLLLDGLDEVKQEHRVQCVEAINAFHQECKVDLVVCSRIADYEAQQRRLQLDRAILLKPLTLPQVDEYLDHFGSEYASLQAALTADETLQELAETPLLLNVMMVAYQGVAVPLSKQQGLLAYRQTLFNRYIQRIFVRRGATHPYPPRQTLWWLTCLAGAMVERRQTVFLIEGLQPDWLHTKKNIGVFRLLFGLGIGLLFALSTWWISGLIFSLILGLSAWLVAELYGRVGSIQPIEKLTFNLKFNFRSFVGWLFIGVLGGILGLLSNGLSPSPLWVPRSLWLTGGLSIGLIFGTMFGIINKVEASDKTRPNQDIWNSAQIMLVSLLIGSVIIGPLGGLVGGIIRGPSLGGGVLSLALFGLNLGLTVGPIIGLIIGLIYGGLACIQHVTLRALLWRYNLAPLNYAKFLDYCAERIFLRRVGGGYIFIHRMLMEHFAAMTEDDIDALVQGIK